MAVKSTLLGGTDFSTPSDRVKPTDLNDTFDAAAGFLIWCATNFNDVAQNIFNADYLGFDSRLNSSGAPNYKNVEYSTFTSDDADINYGFFYDTTNDLYETPDIDNTEYIIIEATSFGTWTNGTNDTYVLPFASGKWLIYCDTGTDAVKRAQIHKSLWYGTDGTNQLILDFTSITAVKTSHANDVGKQAFFAKATNTALSDATDTYDATFADTSTNTNCSSWSRIWGQQSDTSGQSTSDELGTDTSADENNNPADCQLQHTDNVGSSWNGYWEIPAGTVKHTDGATGTGGTSDIDLRVIVLCKGSMTWTNNGFDSATDIDFVTDNSIPLLTAAGSASAEGFDDATLIFKDTIVSTDNAIAVINSTIDATNSEQISISANGGSNWEDVDNAEFARLTAGTALWRRIVVTRTDLSKLDKVTEQAVKYSLI